MYSPSQARTRNSSSSDSSCTVTSGKAVTICCSGGSSALFLNSKSPMARESARLPLTRPNSTKPPAAVILPFSPESRVSRRMEAAYRQITLVLWFVIERKRLCSTLDTEHCSRISRVSLVKLALTLLCVICKTYDIYFVVCADRNGGSAAGNLVFVRWVCYMSVRADSLGGRCAPLSMDLSMAKKPSLSACSR